MHNFFIRSSFLTYDHSNCSEKTYASKYICEKIKLRWLTYLALLGASPLLHLMPYQPNYFPNFKPSNRIPSLAIFSFPQHLHASLYSSCTTQALFLAYCELDKHSPRAFRDGLRPRLLPFLFRSIRCFVFSVSFYFFVFFFFCFSLSFYYSFLFFIIYVFFVFLFSCFVLSHSFYLVYF
jgi:hypothetical protein